MQAEVKRLLELRKTLAEYEDTYKQLAEPLKAERDATQNKITEELKKMGQFSARFEGATVTRSVRKTVKIVDEPALIQTLKEKGMTSYISEQVNDLWEGAAKELAKEGTVLPGTQLEEKEYLSVRSSDKEDARKVTVD